MISNLVFSSELSQLNIKKKTPPHQKKAQTLCGIYSKGALTGPHVFFFSAARVKQSPGLAC